MHKLNILSGKGFYFEGPRWREGRWWVSDFYRHAVFSVTVDGVENEELVVEGQPSGIDWLPDGSMLVVSMKDHRLLRRFPDGAIAVHAEFPELCGGYANDLVVDQRGRAFVGNFGFDLMGGADIESAALIRVDPDGGAAVAADDLLFPNGSVITPDGSTLIVGETFAARYTAFTIHDDGSLSDRRVWAQFGRPSTSTDGYEVVSESPVTPDGCALDAEGHLWVADAAGGRAVRVAPGGRITDEVLMPADLGVFACMLGGMDGRTLLLCTAPDFDEAARKTEREAVLFTTSVAVPRAGRP